MTSIQNNEVITHVESDAEIVTKELHDLLDTSLTGTSAEVKVAQKAFEKFTNSLRNWRISKKQWNVVLNSFEKYKKVDTQHKIFFISILKKIVLSIDRKDKNELSFVSDFMCENIIHPVGGVRNATVHLLDYWYISNSLYYRSTKNSKTLSDELYSFLLRIKNLIVKYEPEDIVFSKDGFELPTYLNELKPSVYKSLVLMWEVATRSTYVEELLKNYPELQVNVPDRNYNDEDWLHENEVDPEEEALNLWGKNPPDGNVQSALLVMESSARKHFLNELDKFGFSKNFSNNLIREMEKHFTFLGEDVNSYDELIMECVRLGIEHDTTDSLIRAFLNFSSHRIITNGINQPMSPILVSVAVLKSETMVHEPSNMHAFVLRMRDAHFAVDIFYKNHVANYEKGHMEMMERIETIHSDRKDPSRSIFDDFKKIKEKHMIELEQSRSIARHVLNWYIQSEPWGVLNKTPEKLAALAYYTVKKVNDDEGQCSVGYTTDELSAFGKWSTNSISGGSTSFYYGVLNSVRDKELLLIKSEEI